jgi:CRP-like cAMP-binding protein/NAD-dependent dihydropyrimidine dehydrogenase PreA subunit
MPLIPDFGLGPREEDEGPFSRDIDGQLIRVDEATEKEFKTPVTLRINGEPVVVNAAKPLQDAQGDPVQENDLTKLRYTTILDAVQELNDRLRQEGREKEEAFVPTLCHQPHMTPVAVCRMCMVLVNGPRPRLWPACLYHVKDGMEVFTRNAPDEFKSKDGESYGVKVKKAVDVIADLLISDHLDQLQPKDDSDEFNELLKFSKRCGSSPKRFDLPALRTGARPVMDDSSSPVFLVKHSACILCDRCIRACNEVVKNDIIGRTGKGRHTSIGFDLNVRMSKSNCVQCGECMVSCPTAAITFKPLKAIESKKGPRLDPVPLKELIRDPLFAGVPPKFLRWQNGLVLRRPVWAGEVLCRQGDPGNRAFIIRRGCLEGVQRDDKGNELRRFERTVNDVIVGEMACLSGGPRNADIAVLEDGEVWEVRRNVLDRMMRAPAQRETFRKIYGTRALDTAMTTLELFAGLPKSESEFLIRSLRPQLKFIQVSPRGIIFTEGEPANDRLYLIRLGHVKVEVRREGREPAVLYRGPNTVIGEVGLLGLSSDDAGRDPEDVDRELCAALARGNAPPTGTRTATCSALDHVELVRIDYKDFLQTIRECPVLRMRLIQVALERLRGDF